MVVTKTTRQERRPYPCGASHARKQEYRSRPRIYFNPQGESGLINVRSGLIVNGGHRVL